MNKAPLYNRELAADADRLRSSVVELNDPITQGVKSMMLLLNKINHRVLENHRRTIKAIEPFISCNNGEVKMYAIERCDDVATREGDDAPAEWQPSSRVLICMSPATDVDIDAIAA